MGKKPTGRKSGAPQGNFNRLKHGFYSAQLRDLNLQEAVEMDTKLEEELALLRALLQKYLEMANRAIDYQSMGMVLELAGRAVTRIGNLVRIQEGLRERGGSESLNAIVDRVLGEMDAELEASMELQGGELRINLVEGQREPDDEPHNEAAA